MLSDISSLVNMPPAIKASADKTGTIYTTTTTYLRDMGDAHPSKRLVPRELLFLPVLVQVLLAGLGLEAPMRTPTTLTTAVALAIFGIACSGSPTDPSRSGNLRLMLTDAPFEEATALHVTFNEVKAHRDDGTQEWLTVPFAGGSTTRTCNLKKLEGPFDLLGVASLEAGQYTQLRLVVSSATIYFGGTPTGEAACATTLAAPGGSGGTSQPVEIPSGEVKLIQPFNLAANGTTTIELDFDGSQSVRQTGNGRYMMSPVIKVLAVKTGS